MERNDIKQTGNEQTEVAAQVAEAKKDEGAAATEISLGKFKDVKSLLKAYGNLESEFTRRSIRLRELEGEILKKNEEITRLCASSGKDKISGDGSAEQIAATDKEFAANSAAADKKVTANNAATNDADATINPAEAKTSDGGEVREQNPTSEKTETIDAEEAVKAYLLRVFKNRPIAPPVFGTAVTAPPKKPRTFEEAGRLVKTNLGL